MREGREREGGRRVKESERESVSVRERECGRECVSVRENV